MSGPATTVDPPRVVAVVLAAGAASRFGAPKLAAMLEGRPVLRHVLDAASAAGLARTIVVTAARAESVGRVLTGLDVRAIVNPAPERGLAGSLHIGWEAAIADGAEAVLVLLGDQPRVSSAVLRRLAEAPLDPARPLLVTRYRQGGGPNPVRIDASATALVEAATGDRGLGPIIATRPGLVRTIEVEGDNPDVDTPADLRRLERP